MIPITINALAVLLATTNSATEVQLLTRTDARARKTSLGKILKESRVIGRIGVEYQKAVNVSLLKSLKLPTFKAAPRVWGKRTGSVVVHKGKQYIQVEVRKSLFPRYFVNDAEVARESIAHLLPIRQPSNRQAAKGLKPEKQVIVASYALENVREIVIGTTAYRVTA